jgi:hypothetical protein
MHVRLSRIREIEIEIEKLRGNHESFIVGLK